MKTRILISLITLILLLAACSKQASDKAASKAKAMAAVPAVLTQPKVNPDDVLTTSRIGNQVTVRWAADFSSCKGIRISRNTTGMGQNRDTVAKLPATSKEYVDNVPDSQAYWYWVIVTLPDGKDKRVGPIRVQEDADKIGNYVDAASDVQFTVRRSENSVAIAWSLPDTKFRSISIKRSANLESRKKRNTKKEILATRELRGNLVDTLPDAEADYWYWIEVTREDGSVFTKGPTKAEFNMK